LKKDIQSSVKEELEKVVNILSTFQFPPQQPVRDEQDDEEEKKDSFNVNNTRTPGRYNPRKSIVESLAKPLPSRLIVPVVHKDVPPYDHIKLYRIKVIEVIDFVEKVSRYQAEHNITLPIQSLLSKDVQEEIIVEMNPDMTRFRKSPS
jgi:hypothetical protein